MPRIVATASFLPAVLLSLASLTTPACQTSRPPRAPETFDDVYEHRESLRDSVITLHGAYMGWNGSECVFPAYAALQATRSDWILKIGETCLYVTGGSPPGLSAMEETPAGQRVSLEVRVRVNPGGRILLEYVRTVPVSD